MIKFTKITIEGVGSIIETITYRLDTKGLTIIDGENGAGKTTIFNALSWALYKRLLKSGSSLEPWEHIKPDDYQGMYVSVEFKKDDVTWNIIRVQDYKRKINGKRVKNGILIFKDGEEEPLKYKGDNQKQIIEILGYSFDLFKSTILFGQELKRMMGEDGPTKKKILEETFDATFINLAREQVSTEIIPISDEYGKLKQEIIAKRTIRDNIRELIQSGKSDLKNFTEVRDKEVRRYQAEIEVLVKEKVEVPEGFDAVEPDNSIIDKELRFNFKLNNRTNELELLKKEAELIREEFMNLPKNCSKCGQPITAEIRTKMIDKLKQNYTKIKNQIFHVEVEVAALNKEYNGILDELDKYKKANSTYLKYKEKAGKNYGIDRKIEQLKDKIKNQKQLKLNVNLESLREKLKIANLAKRENKAKLKKLKKKLDLHTWLLIDPLSNSGLKAFIFDAMLKKINNQLTKYTSRIGFGVRVFIDLKSSAKNVEIAITNQGNEVLYNDLSGGQKQLVDIALLFANNDVVYEDKPINILILDEVFERLKSKNIEIISEIIQMKTATRSIHLITHLATFTTLASKRIYITLSPQGHSLIK